MTLCEAIAKEEGFGIPNGRATRNNNPGDLEYGHFAIANGADKIEFLNPPRVPRFAHFPTAVIGFAAMRALLIMHYSGLTVRQAIMKYAPPIENQTDEYIDNICKWVNCKDTDIIDSLW